jgi:uncharacterized membrane protein
VRRSFVSDRRGSVITVFAFAAMVLAVLTAIVMNQITFYNAKRKLQAAVDMTAMMIMESGDITEARARALVEGQLNGKVGKITVVRGNYTPDAAVSEANRFKALTTPYNAVEVKAEVSGEAAMFAGMMPDGVTMDATARAARRTSASITVGSRLVRLEGGLSAALLDAALGYDGKLTLADYETLATANVDAADYLRALNVEADIKAVTFNDVLSAPVSIGEVTDAFVATTDNGDIIAILSEAAPGAGSGDVIIGKLIDLGSMSGLPIDTLLSGESVPLSVGELLTGSAALADEDHQVALNLSSVLGQPGIANAALTLGEKPQVLHYVGRAYEGDKVETSQFRLDVGALGVNPLTAVKLDVSLANAEVEVDDIKCKSDGSVEVVLKAKTEAASVGVKASVLPRLDVKLGSDESKKLTFSEADIAAQTYKPVRSGLGLQLNGLSVGQKLLFNPVDSLLEKLGLHVAEADVKVTEATCGEVGLVH